MSPDGNSGGDYVTPSNTGAQPPGNIGNRVGNLEELTRNLLLIVVITLLGISVSIIGIVLDQLHFNNELYRDNQYTHTKTVIVTKETKPMAPVVIYNPLAN